MPPIGQQHLLIVSPDASLREELETALKGDRRHGCVLHIARDLTQAVDLARDLSPRLALVDMGGDIARFKETLRELLAVSPETFIAGAYRTELLEQQERMPGGLFVEGMRAGAQDFLRRPISLLELRQWFDRVEGARHHEAAVPGTTVAFLSNKGGVGKTTLAVNTAVRLAMRHPGEVLLIDASLQMGLCAAMLDLKPRTTLLDTLRERQRLDSTLIRQLTTPHESGLDLLAAPPDAVSAADVDDQLLTRVLNLARRSYRYLVIDTFPVFDSIVMAILDASDLGMIVLDNVVPTVISITHLLSLLDELGHPVERRRMIVNRMKRVSGNPTQTDIESTLKTSIDYIFPYDHRALTAANLGRPFALQKSWWSGLERNLKKLVQEIEGHTRRADGGHLSDHEAAYVSNSADRRGKDPSRNEVRAENFTNGDGTRSGALNQPDNSGSDSSRAGQNRQGSIGEGNLRGGDTHESSSQGWPHE